MHIAIYFLIQLFRRYIVNRGEIGIQQNLLVADGKDEGFPSGLLFHVLLRVIPIARWVRVC